MLISVELNVLILCIAFSQGIVTRGGRDFERGRGFVKGVGRGDWEGEIIGKRRDVGVRKSGMSMSDIGGC